LINQLSPDARKSLSDAIASAKPALDRMFDEASAVPGAALVIKATVDSIRSKLEVLQAA
jgi:hypothetical protein